MPGVTAATRPVTLCMPLVQNYGYCFRDKMDAARGAQEKERGGWIGRATALATARGSVEHLLHCKSSHVVAHSYEAG